MHSKVYGEIIYPLLNLNGAAVEVKEWISNSIPHITWHVITYPCWDFICNKECVWDCEGH